MIVLIFTPELSCLILSSNPKYMYQDLKIDEYMAALINALMAAYRAKDETEKERILKEIRRYELYLQNYEPPN